MFLAELGPAVGRPVPGVSREAKELLLSYPWPGNVRELRNALERVSQFPHVAGPRVGEKELLRFARDAGHGPADRRTELGEEHLGGRRDVFRALAQGRKV